MGAGSCTCVFINRKEERHSQTATATNRGMKSIWLDCKYFTYFHQQQQQKCIFPQAHGSSLPFRAEALKLGEQLMQSVERETLAEVIQPT